MPSANSYGVSIVIPAFNVEPFIRDAIESALGQSCQPREVIVVDDGSTDGTADIVKGMHSPLLRLIRQARAGPGAARNTGLELVTSSHVQFLDADDVLAPGCIECFENAASEVPRLDFFAFSAKLIPSPVSSLPSDHYQRHLGHFRTGSDALQAMLRDDSFLPSPCLYAFSRASANTRPIRFGRFLHEDEAFTPALMLRCGESFISPMTLYHRRIRADSIMFSPPGPANVQGYLSAAKVWEEIVAQELPSRSRRYAKRYASKLRTRALKQALRAGMPYADFRKLSATTTRGTVIAQALRWIGYRLAWTEEGASR